MTRRLERSVQAQPDSAENLYFLARSYMAQNRPGDAAQMFERSVALAGRQPELLGQWAQALYFASDKHFTPQVQVLTDEALQADPREVTSLGLLGIAAFETQRYQAAVDYWTRLLAALPADDASRSALEGGIARARENLAKRAADVAPPVKAKSIRIHVELAPALQGKVRPSDSVFIFARAIKGPAAPGGQTHYRGGPACQRGTERFRRDDAATEPVELCASPTGCASVSRRAANHR